MKKIRLFISTVLLLQILYSPSFGQNDLVINQISGGVVSYTTQTITSDTHVFTLFGDGNFSIQKSPTHKFAPSENGYLTETFFARPYDPVLPPKKTVTTGSIGTGGNYTNPVPALSGDIDLFTSWATAVGYETFFIIAFTNTSDPNPISGCIEFAYDPNELNVNFPEIREYNGWVINRMYTPPSGNNTNGTIMWNYQDLAYNETRYVYVPATIPDTTTVGEKLSIYVNNIVDCNSMGDSKITSFFVRRFPHDPNFKIVDKTCLQKEVGPQRLEYTIGFFNDGTYFANNVYLTDVLSPLLDISTVTIVDSEYPPTVITNDPVLRIQFLGIDLPGTNQTFPNAYTYEDAFSYVTFGICTVASLSEDDKIENEADIVFDEQPIFTTDVSEIAYDPDCFGDICTPSGAGSQSGSSLDGIVETKELSTFEVSPNPTSDKISVLLEFENNEEKLVHLSIMNLAGQVVRKSLLKEEYIEEFREDFYIGDLANGIYLIVLQTDQNTYVRKILKE